MKKFLTPAFLVIAIGYLIIQNLPKIPRYTPVQSVQAAAVTVVYTPLPTDTPMPTLTPLPTIDYRATDQSFQLAMESQRNDMVKAQLAHEEEMIRQQVELAKANALGLSVGATQTFAPTAIALTDANMTQVSGYITSTAEAPAREAQLLQVQDDAKHYQEQRVKENIAYAVVILFVLSLTVLIIRKAIVINAAYIEKIEQEDRAARKPNEAPVVDYVISEDPINRRMEQRFATVLLAMHALEPDDAAVNLLESFWVVRGARDKFQNRSEFLDVRDDWASDTNGILKRVDPSVKNSTFYVAKWDEVQLIADGARLQPPPQDGFIPYSAPKAGESKLKVTSEPPLG